MLFTSFSNGAICEPFKSLAVIASYRWHAQTNNVGDCFVQD